MLALIIANLLLADQPRLQVQTGHRQAVTCLDIYAGVVAFGSQDRTVTLYNLETGRQVRHLTGPEGAVHDVVLGRDLKSVSIRFDSGSPSYLSELAGWDLQHAGKFGKATFVGTNADDETNFLPVPGALFARGDGQYREAATPDTPISLPGKLMSVNREGTAAILSSPEGLKLLDLRSGRAYPLPGWTTLPIPTETGAVGIVAGNLTRWSREGKVIRLIPLPKGMSVPLEAAGDTVLVWTGGKLVAYDAQLNAIVSSDARPLPKAMIIESYPVGGPDAVVLRDGFAEYRDGKVMIWTKGISRPRSVSCPDPPVWSYSRAHFGVRSSDGMFVYPFSDASLAQHIEFSAATSSAFPTREGTGLVVVGAGHTIYFDLISGRPTWTRPSAPKSEWVELDRGERSGHGATLIETQDGWDWVENDSGSVLSTLSKKDYVRVEVSRSAERLIGWTKDSLVGLSLPDLTRLWTLPGVNKQEFDDVTFSRLARVRGDQVIWTDLDADIPVAVQRMHSDLFHQGAFSSRDGSYGGVLGVSASIVRLDQSSAWQDLDGMANSRRDFSWNSTYFGGSNPNRDCWVWRTSDGKVIKELYAGRDGGPWMFTQDERLFIASTPEGPLMTVDLPSGREGTLAGHSGRVLQMAELPAKNVVVTVGSDGAAKLWRGGRELCTIVVDLSGRWAVVAPDGRFDTNRPEAVTFLSWVLAESPLQAVPLETYMKEYFEPFLLRKLLDKVSLPSLPPLRARDLPKVGKVEARVGDDGRYVVSVTLPQSLRAAYLLREGQLTATLTNLKTGVVSFPPIRVSGKAKLSVYGFDSAGLKTVNVSTLVDAKLDPSRPRAFVVAVGLDVYSDPRLRLSWAANDASSMVESLSKKLGNSGLYRNVHTYSILSTPNQFGGDLKSLRATFAEIARFARQQDVLIICWSGHGATVNGAFRFLTREATQEKPVGLTPTMLREWLLPMDASRIALALDTCSSAATIDTPGFRPGPLGGRTFGQTAYDKAMFVVSATQSKETALEDSSLGHGLLTFALLEGLDKRQQATYTEWLVGAANQVPELWKRATGNTTKAGTKSPPVLKGFTQRAVIFDFRATDWGRIY